MAQKKIATDLSPSINIQSIQGSLQVKGWDRLEVLLRAREENAVLEKQTEGISIRCLGDCEVRLPHDADVAAATIHGNARFKLLEGELRIDQVLGSLEMRDIDLAQVGSVHGNLVVKQASGDVEVQQVLGSALARDVQGKCVLKRVAGNLDLRDTDGDIDVTVQGNARVRLCLLAGKNYRIQVDGDLQCIVPEDASLLVNMSSKGRRIQVRLPDATTTLAEENYSLKLGNGEAEMALFAGGTVFFASREADWAEMDDVRDELDDAFSEFSEEMGTRIAGETEDQIETQMELLNEHLAKLELLISQSGMPQAEADRVMRRAREAQEKANARAQEKIRRAHLKMERKLEAATRKAEMKMKAADRRPSPPTRQSWKFEWPAPPTTPTKTEASESVTDQERLLILQMLEQKKISIAEAEQLLAALEGK